MSFALRLGIDCMKKQQKVIVPGMQAAVKLLE
jgi:hypothetical protein